MKNSWKLSGVRCKTMFFTVVLSCPVWRGTSSHAAELPQVNPDIPLTRIAFGSCTRPNLEQPMLAEQLRQPAEVRLVASGIQVIAQDHKSEKWLNLPFEQQRLFNLIRDTKANGVVLLSCDRHLAELSMRTDGTPYPLYDLTSSGLNSAATSWRPLEINRYRVATMNWGHNFGMVKIDWNGPSPRLDLQIHDADGEVTINQKVMLSTLLSRK
jgi:hypothetical protein